MNLNKLVVFFTLFLFSCSNHIIQAEEIKPEKLKCGSSSSTNFYKNNGVFTYDDKNFTEKLRLLDGNLKKESFNFLYITEPKSSGGYTLELLKIVKKRNKHKLYFKELKPAEGSGNIAAITATYCLLKIENLNKFKVYIDNE